MSACLHPAATLSWKSHLMNETFRLSQVRSGLFSAQGAAGETPTWSEMNSRHFVTYKNSLHIKYQGRYRLNLGAPNP